MKKLGFVFVFTVGFAAVAGADPVGIKGTFGFDAMRPKARCVKVSGTLHTKLTKRYACTATETQSASGKPIVAECAAKKGTSHYLLFATAKDCDEERETQLANGEG